MKAHVEATIRDLEEEITRTQEIILHLRRMDGVAVPAVTAPVLVVKDPENGKTTAMKAYARRNGAPNKRRGRPAGSRGTHDALGACLRLEQPFTRIVLSEASGLTKNGAGSQITRWERAGFVKRVGFGLYERTAKFPATQAAETRVAVPGLDQPVSTVAQQLEKALKDRDDARAKGLDKLAKILQDKVDKLQAQLS